MIVYKKITTLVCRGKCDQIQPQILTHTNEKVTITITKNNDNDSDNVWLS